MRFAALAISVGLAVVALRVTAPAQSRKTPSHPAPAPAPAPTPIAAGTPQVVKAAITKPGPDYHFPVGQTFVYSGAWRIFNAGTATIHMDQAGAENRISGTANAGGAAALLYHVQDRYESFLDPATFCSRNTSRHIEEGFRRVDTNITFDYARGKAVFEQKNLVKKESKREEHAIPGCVTDVLSGIFYVSSLPLQVGSTYSFPLSDGGEAVTVNVLVEGREKIKTPAGTFNTIRVQPQTTTGVLKDKGKIWVWYSDDSARIPVQIRAHLYWGTLTFTLQRIDRK
jgi:Protein of unknown function (DUF3108)